MKTEDPKERYAAAFAEFLAEQLSRSMISISELSRRSGVSKQLISSIARKTPHHRTNKLVLPSISTVDAIARGLGAPAAEARAAAGYAAGESQPAGAESSASGKPDPFSAALGATIEAFRSLPAADRRRLLRVLVIATRDTGLRRSALLALTWEMVDWENRLLRIPKGNLYKRRPAVIGCTDRLLGELRRLWEASEQDPAARVFGEVKGWKRSYATACRLAGIEGLRFNDWRHGFVTDLMEAGIPQHMAMKLSGHTQADTHEIYANIDDRLAIQAAAALDRLHASRTTRSAEPEPATGLVN